MLIKNILFLSAEKSVLMGFTVLRHGDFTKTHVRKVLIKCTKKVFESKSTLSGKGNLVRQIWRVTSVKLAKGESVTRLSLLGPSFTKASAMSGLAALIKTLAVCPGCWKTQKCPLSIFAIAS